MHSVCVCVCVPVYVCMCMCVVCAYMFGVHVFGVCMCVRVHTSVYLILPWMKQ